MTGRQIAGLPVSNMEGSGQMGAVADKLGGIMRLLTDGGDDESRARSGALFTFAIRIASAALAFFSQVLLARWLGTFDFGVYTYVWVWINVLGTLCTVGLSSTSVRFLAEYAKPHLHGLLRGFLRFGRVTSFAAGALAAGAGYAILHLAPCFAKDHYHIPLSIALLALPAFALTDFHDGVGRGRSWIGLAFVPPYILRPLLLLIFIAALVIVGGERNATSAAAALVAATWITAGVQFFLLHRRFGQDHPASMARQYRPRLWLGVSVPLLLMESFALLMMNIDVLLLERFVQPDRIAIYFAAARTISFISFIHFAVSAVAMPRFAAAFTQRDTSAAAAYLVKFRAWTLWPSVALAVILLTFGKFILALFGPAFPAAWPVMFALVAGHLTRAVAGPAESLLMVSGHQVYTAVITGLTAALNIAFNLALIPRYGLIGAGLATAAAFAFQSAALTVASRRVLEEGFHTKGSGMAGEAA